MNGIDVSMTELIDSVSFERSVRHTLIRYGMLVVHFTNFVNRERIQKEYSFPLQTWRSIDGAFLRIGDNYKSLFVTREAIALKLGNMYYVNRDPKGGRGKIIKSERVANDERELKDILSGEKEDSLVVFRFHFEGICPVHDQIDKIIAMCVKPEITAVFDNDSDNNDDNRQVLMATVKPKIFERRGDLLLFEQSDEDEHTYIYYTPTRVFCVYSARTDGKLSTKVAIECDLVGRRMARISFDDGEDHEAYLVSRFEKTLGTSEHVITENERLGTVLSEKLDSVKFYEA